MFNFWRKRKLEKECEQKQDDWDFILEWHPRSRILSNWWLLELDNLQVQRLLNPGAKQFNVLNLTTGKIVKEIKALNLIEPYRLSCLDISRTCKSLYKEGMKY